MIDKKVIYSDRVQDTTLAHLDSRDIALWIREIPKDTSLETLTAFIGLPWRLIVSEVNDSEMLEYIANSENTLNPMTRKRGFIQIIDSDPSRIELPQRCLPIYLLKGRRTFPPPSDFENKLRQMTMLETLRRSGIHETLIISGHHAPVPADLGDLWSSGFRSYITFATDAVDSAELVSGWLKETNGISTATLLHMSSRQAIESILRRYGEVYPEHKRIIRVRNRNGLFNKIDITQTEDLERPILSSYSLLEERDLSIIIPEDLSKEDFVSFFKSSESSWRPYAAGLPWIRDSQYEKDLHKCMKKLDTGGSDEDCVAYIVSEPGAGGTTLARALAFTLAQRGYPALIAKPLPFTPDALPIVNFMNRVKREIEDQSVADRVIVPKPSDEQPGDSSEEKIISKYETPWLIVFETLHWQFRDNELVSFINELERSGRPACILIVTGSALSPSFRNTSIFKKIAELNHALDLDEARELGHHLNTFLRVYGEQRPEWQWERFYEDHTVRYLEGISAFWVTLSFWIQGQYDLSESIQQWMYKSFKENIDQPVIRSAVLEIAALSSERLPMPEGLLPRSQGEWPISVVLDNLRSQVANLGLMRVSSDGEKYWALVHDILGRFLINALFYDFAARDSLGFAEAKDPEHLRFLLLRNISAKPELGERTYRSIGEDFATSIFKIDPDHGRGSFVSIWEEVLRALDNMPRTLRDTSRVFRHHVAVSRRRIAKLDENFYGVNTAVKITLLNRAIDDINFALNSIDEKSRSESDLNLYNSLANAYFDLADAETKNGSSVERINELRRLANNATRKAYEENPTNSFVIETYIKNLLTDSRDTSTHIIERCIEALGILYQVLMEDEGTYRRTQLSTLADQALKLLFDQSSITRKKSEPSNAIDVLIDAWIALTEGRECPSVFVLADTPETNRANALNILKHPAGQGNMQVMRLKYDLIRIHNPYGFKDQLELVEQLQATNYRMTPQLRLEYAILLFQNSRAIEGEKVFRFLRKLWRENEYFVRVPDHLHWLRDIDGKGLKAVHAVMGEASDYRPMARVQEFQNMSVPFRPEEFGLRSIPPRTKITCHVTFGYKGPFLRPANIQPAATSRGASA